MPFGEPPDGFFGLGCLLLLMENPNLICGNWLAPPHANFAERRRNQILLHWINGIPAQVKMGLFQYGPSEFVHAALASKNGL